MASVAGRLRYDMGITSRNSDSALHLLLASCLLPVSHGHFLLQTVIPGAEPGTDGPLPCQQPSTANRK